jgi:glycosyltransferase involved in cell wall biosynthesis
LRGRVLILRQSEPFPFGWVRNEAVALADAGYAVTVIGPTGYEYASLDETIGGVRALRFVPPPGGRGAVGYLREYATAAWRMLRLIRLARREGRFDAVIASGPPDFLVWFALPFRRTGAGIVFDQRDPAPELFEAKFGRRGLLHRALIAQERSAWRRADVGVPHNESCAELARERGGLPDDRIVIVGVGPDPRRIYPVDPRPDLRRGKRHLVLWIGTMSDQEGLGRLVDAIEILVRRRERDDVAFAIVGPGDAREPILDDLRRRGLDDAVDMPGVVTDDDLFRAYLSTADVCLSVDEANGMNDRSTMMKVLEYMAVGRPVVQFPLVEMSRLCGDATLYAREDPVDLADKIAQLLDDEALRASLGRRARERMDDRRLWWSDQAPALVEAVERARARAGAS